MIYLLTEIKKELTLRDVFIIHEFRKGDKEIDILISERDFSAINFPSNYKLMKYSTYNKHFIYIRFDKIDQSFIKIDFVIDGLDYCNEKIVKSKLIRKKLYNYIVYHIKKKFFNLKQSRNKFIIVVMGIDGAGKSTLVRELEKELSGVFNVKTTYMGWHGFYLWPIKVYRYFKYKHKDTKKRKTLDKSIKRIGFIENIAVFIELYSRYLKSILDRNSEIILFDRYFYDSIIRSKDHFWEKFFIYFVPKPDLFILLDAPDNVLYSRKKEISPENIKLLKNIIYSKDYLKPIVIDTYENDISACLKLANAYIFQNVSINSPPPSKAEGFDKSIELK